MIIPLSWLKDFVDIKLPLKDLIWKMTEAGLTCESYNKVGDEILLDVEVTANRPDWMSILGIAREVAAIQGTKLKTQEINGLDTQETKNKMAIKLNPDFELFDRWSGLIIKGVTIKPSAKWLADRIRLMGHEPINNVIDITNYVMYEYGIPLHAFDYDEIKGAEMTVQKSHGGEEFTSVDDLTYLLPKDAIVIKDRDRIIDLAGIKGGLNSGIMQETKNVFLHITINNPVLIRRASIALGLRSDASAIYERGPDKGGVLRSLSRAANLILQNAGGEIGSDIIDIKKSEFKDQTLELSLEKLEKVLGIKISTREVEMILHRLNLTPIKRADKISCMIPTYRGDIKIEEDLIEEVARIYGYNRFPKTLPIGRHSTQKIPYYFDASFQKLVSDILVASGFSQVMNLSLISTELIENCLLNPNDHITIENPVSLDYEHMRKSLIPSLLLGIKLNRDEKVRLFELDKVYSSEKYNLSSVVRGLTFRGFKGVIDLLLARLNIEGFKIEFETQEGFWHPGKSATVKIGKDILGSFGEINPQVLSNLSIKDQSFAFEFDIANLQKYSQKVIFKSVPEFPPQIEDITLTFPVKTRIGEVLLSIRNQESRIANAELKDTYKDSYTFRLWYQDSKKTLTDKEVEEIRKKMLSSIKAKFGGIVKD